jgi:predicted flap endonuclease-1-like 5' DNA nuclease
LKSGRASVPGSEERMTYPISHIDGLDADTIKTLRSNGLRTTARFLEAAKDAKGRKHLSEKTGIECPRLLEIANACDHLRIKGMGKGYSALLREVGVTVRELQFRNPATLAKRMAEANKKHKLVRFLPSDKLVGRWIDQAKKLPLKITY